MLLLIWVAAVGQKNDPLWNKHVGRPVKLLKSDEQAKLGPQVVRPGRFWYHSASFFARILNPVSENKIPMTRHHEKLVLSS